MIDEKTNKFNLIIYLLIFIVLFTMLIGTSYLYFTNKIKNESKTKISINNADVFVEYKKGNQINVSSIKHGWSSSISFSVENYSLDTNGKYKILLDIISPLSDEIDDNFILTLSGASTSNDKPINIKEKVVPVESTMLSDCLIFPETLHTYILTIKLKDNKQDINHLKNRIFIAKVNVEKVDL
ncbi:MAG: hypothetical protein GX758_01910 [Tenericutes bacterium]|nr:hypothetical protein [Mycoplasmatota bacterium]